MNTDKEQDDDGAAMEFLIPSVSIRVNPWFK